MSTQTTKLAMIGTRGHYSIALRELSDLPQVELAAVAPGGDDDSVQPILDWTAKNNHQPLLQDDWRQMLDGVKPDAVVVCGPFELHAEMTIAAMERGIHVYAEKPCAITLADLNRLRTCVAHHPQVHLAAMMQSRYDAGFYTAHQLIRGGAIGDVRLINARKSYKRGRRADYYRHRATYGGTISWVGSHAIDWMMWLAGAPIESVIATQSSEHNGGIGTMESTAACLFQLAGGRAATVSIDVLRPENAPSHGDDWIRIVGSEGVIEARPESVSLINAHHNGPSTAGCDRKPFADFIHHLRGESTAIIDAKQTLDLTEALLLAQQSADERRPVAFPNR
jgi:predicted dehydrogenase